MKQLRGLLVAGHPGPSIVVTAVAVILALAVGVDAGRAVLVGLAVLTGQLSGGWSNDWMDATRDRLLVRQDKPLVSGLISPRTVRAAAFLALAATLVFSFTLGLPAAIAQVGFVASAWAYNAGLKATAWSWLPYAAGFGLLPLVASFALPEPRWTFGWVVAAGALLGIAAHFANVLPDLAGDRRTGVRGLPHRLGKQASGIIPFLLLAVVAILVSVGPLVAAATAATTATVATSWIPWFGLAASLAISVIGIVIVRTRPASRTLMRLIMLGALVDVTMLALTGTAMVGS